MPHTPPPPPFHSSARSSAEPTSSVLELASARARMFTAESHFRYGAFGSAASEALDALDAVATGSAPVLARSESQRPTVPDSGVRARRPNR